MSKYLIEVPHEADRIECYRAVQILLSTGNHFLTNADWGCHDHVHMAWFFAEVDSKEEALRIVPPFYREKTKVTLLNKFNLREVDEILSHHDAHKEVH
jgi:hypothetical protein